MVKYGKRRKKKNSSKNNKIATHNINIKMINSEIKICRVLRFC